MRIVHISDLHFGMNRLEIADAFLQDLSSVKPELIIISGDLTQRAKDEQFLALQIFLKQLPAEVLVVPGNHDIPLCNVYSRFISPFKAYRHYVGNQFKDKFSNDDIAILGINSVNPYKIKDGKLSKKNLKAINYYFKTEDKSANILFFHHNFDQLKDMHKPLENEKQFLSYLKDSKVNIVCTGHLHFAHVGLIQKNNKKPCLVLHAGSLLCTRSRDGLNSYFVIDIDDHNCSVNWRVFSEQQFIVRTNYSIKLSALDAKLRYLTFI